MPQKAAGYAVESGGATYLSDGAARVAAEGGVAHAGGYRGGRATATASGDEGVLGGAPGVVALTLVGEGVGGAHGELVHVDLSDEEGASLGEVAGDGALYRGLVGVQGLGAVGGVALEGAVVLLDADGHAVDLREHGAVHPAELALLGLGLGALRREVSGKCILRRSPG